MDDDLPDPVLTEVMPGGSRADGKDNIWTYDEAVGRWVAPDGSMVEAPPPPEKKGGFQKGNKLAKGTKTAYRPKFAKIAKDACQRGLTDAEIADLFDIGPATLIRWRNKYPLFAEAFRLGKRIAHDRVERALYSKAVGYEYLTERVVNGHKVTLRQQLPPDTAAAVFYLKNRRPKKWKDIHRQEVGPAGAFDQIEDAGELRKLLTQRALELGLIMPSEVKQIEGTATEITDIKQETE